MFCFSINNPLNDMLVVLLLLLWLVSNKMFEQRFIVTDLCIVQWLLHSCQQLRPQSQSHPFGRVVESEPKEWCGWVDSVATWLFERVTLIKVPFWWHYPQIRGLSIEDGTNQHIQLSFQLNISSCWDTWLKLSLI